MIFALFILSQLPGILLQTGLPISVIPWFAVTIVVALVVIIAAAAIYMLAPVLNSSAMKQWSLFQIYEAALSIILIILFLGVVKIFFVNPQQGFAGAGLVPQGCTAANTIYTLSTCDLAQFNSASYTVAGFMWAFAIAKGVIPSATLAIQPTPQEGDGLEFIFTIPNFLDAGNSKIISYTMGAVLIALLLSQLQLILLSSSLMLLSLFFTIGLIARVFGISRSFGGAMIAFGLGLGIIYPLLIAITYGYIDVSANTFCLSGPFACAASATGFGSSFFASVTSPFPIMSALAGSVGSTLSTVGGVALSPLQSLAGAIAYFYNEIGYVLAGLTLIPIINILIVDVFIIDFSKAVGERMSFAMLFQGLV